MRDFVLVLVLENVTRDQVMRSRLWTSAEEFFVPKSLPDFIPKG
jgi:hypothetical protein